MFFCAERDSRSKIGPQYDFIFVAKCQIENFHRASRDDGASPTADRRQGPRRNRERVSPSVQHDAPRAQCRIRFVHPLQPIGRVVTSRVTLPYQSPPLGAQMRSVDIRRSRICARDVRPSAAAPVARDEDMHRTILLETPQSQTTASRMLRQIPQQRNTGIEPVLATVVGQLGGPTAKTFRIHRTASVSSRPASSGMPTAARAFMWVSGLRITAVSGVPGSTI